MISKWPKTKLSTYKEKEISTIRIAFYNSAGNEFCEQMPVCDVCGKFVKDLAKHKRRKRCGAKKSPPPTLDNLRNRIAHGW